MKALWYCLMGLMLLCGCSSIHSRKQERATAFASLPAAEKGLVSRGQIERGMDTNSVYIAWGKPSAVSITPSGASAPAQETWVYYGNRPVLNPAWSYIPEANGYGRIEYTPVPHSEAFIKAEVHFQNGRVVDWKRF
jgi:hypothetical protein